jgi:hypothetical protein
MQSDNKAYKGMISTGSHILHTEKFIGLYKGFFANTLINVPISSM